MRIGESRIGMEDPTTKVGEARIGLARVADSKLESDMKRDPSDLLSEKLFNSKKSLEVSTLVGDIAVALVDAKDANEQAKLKSLYEVAKRRVEDLRQSESKPKVAQKEATPVVEETPVPEDISDTTEQPALRMEGNDEAAPAEAAEMPAEEPPVDEGRDADVLDFNAREREVSEPTLEEKLIGLQKKQEHKLNVKERVVASLNGKAEFTFNQADPDWLEACGEVLSDNDVVPSAMADTFQSYSDDMRSYGRKELRGADLMQAVETIKRGEESVKQILDMRRKAERAGGPGGQSLEQKISGNVFLENDAYQDFQALLQGRDTGSRNSATEGYWKNMQKFFSIDSKFSGAKAVVDQILTEKTYSKADNRGVNKELGKKVLEMKNTLQETGRQQAA